MLKPNPDIVPPENENAKIWRYMDFPKFVSLLNSRSLYFSRSDLLGDPYEASYPRVNQEIREHYIDELMAKLPRASLPEGWREDFFQGRSETNKFIASCMFVNCWHINEYESYGMWKLYVKDSKGIVIQSTYKLLRDLLPEDVFIGVVDYIDYTSQPLKEGELFAPIFHKRKSFDFENELRAVKFSLDEARIDNENNRLKESKKVGIKVPVDIRRLIEEIYVAPSSEEWFYELVSDISKGFELDVSVQKSPLDDEPFF